jgi:hypothetical protein
VHRGVRFAYCPPCSKKRERVATEQREQVVARDSLHNQSRTTVDSHETEKRGGRVAVTIQGAQRCGLAIDPRPIRRFPHELQY